MNNFILDDPNFAVVTFSNCQKSTARVPTAKFSFSFILWIMIIFLAKHNSLRFKRALPKVQRKLYDKMHMRNMGCRFSVGISTAKEIVVEIPFYRNNKLYFPTLIQASELQAYSH